MTNFIDRNPTLETYWRSIILLGRNVASYKFALAKSLLDIPAQSSTVKMEDLAMPFALNICEHLRQNDKQVTSASSKFLDYCREFNIDKIGEDELRSQTLRLGFGDVIGAFHNVVNAEVPRFFEDTRREKGAITLSDNFYRLVQSKQRDNLAFEINSRWRLWETAISLDLNPRLIQINQDSRTDTLFVMNGNTRRVDVTSSRDALNGYQKGKCFYCEREIMIVQGLENSCDVDHFFPDKLKEHGFRGIDQVWNLVLACRSCNRGEGGKFERIPAIQFLERLHDRNCFYVESHHPLKETIINQTGKSENERRSFLQDHYNKAVDAIPSRAKWEPPEIDKDDDEPK